MKKINIIRQLLPIFILVLLLASCKKEGTNTPETKQPTHDRVSLTYDAEANTITSTPGDSVSTYVVVVWMVNDFILDYGNDFSESNLRKALSSYINDCIDYDLGIPLFEGIETTYVYDWFDQPYPGEEFIVIASPFNESNNTIFGPVTTLRFTTK